MQIESAALTDTGLLRDQNEDRFLERPATGLFAVADGMGGHAAGEVASAIAVAVVERAGLNGELHSLAALRDATRRANQEILAHAAEHPEYEGMGTTLTSLLVGEGELFLAHVGDSRLYRLRDRTLAQLTRDHTWVQEQVNLGTLDAPAARSHPLASLLTRALGTDPQVEVDTARLDAQPGDLLLLCTDGLSGMLTDAEIQRLLLEDTPLEARARALVAAANHAGGRDNSTVVLVQLS